MEAWTWAAERICVECGKETEKGTGLRRYCSASCERAHRANRPSAVPCQSCGKEIDLSRRANGRLPRSDVAYCRDCRNTPAALRFKKYGITASDFERMATSGCAICTRKDRPLHVDHDHACCPTTFTCGACVRGLLCGPCNRAIGLLGDSPSVAASATTYLERVSSDRH